ncbi:MAG: VOC family protein [Kangiellaceae bacterium]|nr:VOC family protein [Kangiellaceae bacterium]
MSKKPYKSSNKIRTQFAAAMSAMHRDEVAQYASLFDLVKTLNELEVAENPANYESISSERLECERHGAIRLGTEYELATMRRLFAVMGMYPVDYYDLSVAGIPVHSTAFRPTGLEDIKANPFRIFTSLLRLDLIEDKDLRENAETALAKRNIFSVELLALIESHEKQKGLRDEQAQQFVKEALEVFRWHQQAQVDSQTYHQLTNAHRLIADVVSFKGPHINHLTPRSLDIDALQTQLSKKFKAKKVVEGPPRRDCPILLRQTSFIALEESVVFSDGIEGTHTARFGEVEQRGIALTPKGRKLYDELLDKARANKGNDYEKALQNAFVKFPDSHQKLHDEKLAYYQYSAVTKPDSQADPLSISQLIEDGNLTISPIVYEDFLPVSAAGIFSSNLADTSSDQNQIKQSSNKTSFEKALGATVIDSFSLYEKMQQASLATALKQLGIVVL